MLEVLWQLAIFFLGISIGKSRAENVDTVNKNKYMQDLINHAYEERDQYKIIALDAEQRAESWERRYRSLEKKENQVGS